LWQDIKQLTFLNNSAAYMPVILKIDPLRRLVYSTFYGRITDDEMLNHRSAIASDPNFNPDFSEIVDFSAVSDIDISEGTLTALAGTQSLYKPSVLHIVVAPHKATSQMANHFKTLAQQSRPNLHVVRTRAQAYKLLGMKPE
jgi:hypothetical protein